MRRLAIAAVLLAAALAAVFVLGAPRDGEPAPLPRLDPATSPPAQGTAAGASGEGRVARASVAEAPAQPPLTGTAPVAQPALPPRALIPFNQQAQAFRQRYNLTCEVGAFKQMLYHYGLDPSEEELQALLGQDENPNRGFRGDYTAPQTNGFQNYGAHAPAVKRLIESYPQPGRFRAGVLYNLDQARAALAAHQLVMVWIPVALEQSSAQLVTLSTGERVSMVPGEHVVVLHGYDPGGFYVYDPRPSPRLPSYVAAEPLAKGMALFEQPALALEPPPGTPTG